MKTVFRSKRVVLGGAVAAASVHVAGGRILAVEAFEHTGGAPTIDFGELALLPGLVDTHVHINEPGRTEWEGFETATRAAAAGGVTTVVDMPLNSIPPVTTVGGVDQKAALTEGRIFVDVGLWGGAVPENTSSNPRGLGDLLREGVRGFKCFMVPSGVDEFQHVTDRDIRSAMSQLRDEEVRLMVHAEVEGPIASATAALAKEDPTRYETYLRSRPPSAEEEAVRRLYEIAKATGGALHIVHLSAAGALDTLARARDEGVRLTAETAPHYLFFDAEEIADRATWFKCAPPIRERENRERLWRALREGLIEMVVSDHSPCVPALKRLETGDFMEAWGGISGLQYGFGAVWGEARRRGFSLSDVALWMSERPAKHAGLGGRKGAIREGFDADFVVLDDAETFIVSGAESLHRNKLTPYDGRTLSGVIHSTWLRGEQVYSRQQTQWGKPQGTYLKR